MLHPQSYQIHSSNLTTTIFSGNERAQQTLPTDFKSKISNSKPSKDQGTPNTVCARGSSLSPVRGGDLPPTQESPQATINNKSLLERIHSFEYMNIDAGPDDSLHQMPSKERQSYSPDIVRLYGTRTITPPDSSPRPVDPAYSPFCPDRRANADGSVLEFHCNNMIAESVRKTNSTSNLNLR